MATNPYFTQLHTQRFSFIGSPQQRDGTDAKDQRFVNFYPELIKSPISDGKKYYLKKRPGVAPFLNLGAGQGRGTFFWQSNGNYLSVVGNILYSNSTPIQTLNTSSGPVGFAEFKTDTEDVVVLCDGFNGWTIGNGNAVNLITDPNFPTPHIPNPIYLDGYLFLAKATTQTIYNSNLNDQTTWPVDGFIDAEMFPDNLVGLAKVQNYLACVGAYSIEWMYDNANATGSPLQRNAPAVSQFGCPAPSTISQTELELILVGTTANGGRTVWTINGFQPTEIGNAPVREALDLEGPSITLATAFTIQCAGHKWYVLNLYSSSRTFVYDFEEQMWHEWSDVNGNKFPFDYAADAGDGQPLLLGQSNATASYVLSPTNYTDNNVLINCEATTVKIDFDTIMRKRIFRLSIIGDSPNGDVNTPMTVYWSDDDYNTWSSGETLLLNGTYPTITQLGITRRRAFKFIYKQPYPLRMESFELDYTQEVRR